MRRLSEPPVRDPVLHIHVFAQRRRHVNTALTREQEVKGGQPGWSAHAIVVIHDGATVGGLEQLRLVAQRRVHRPHPVTGELIGALEADSSSTEARVERHGPGGFTGGGIGL
ncbi:hypothetical protein ON010_g19022 [Phytophthora cinnamomi]|nr:hypothetical protein ON010_g19022 [Phytophthora cinnamomi]